MFSDSLPYLLQTVFIARLEILDTFVRRFPDILNTRLRGLRQIRDGPRHIF